MKSDFTSLIIRRAELADAEAITEIYNEAILATTATFDTEAERRSGTHRMAQVTRRQASGPGGSVREQNRGLVGIESMVGTTRL